MTDTNTDTETEVALAEEMNHNLRQLAKAVGLKVTDLHTGASRKEARQAHSTKALLGMAKSDEFTDDRSDTEVLEDVRWENAQNVLRIAEAAGVRKMDLKGEVANTELEKAWAETLDLSREDE